MPQTPFIKTLATVLVAMLIVSVLFYRGCQSRYGEPDESRRVSHPAGFSIIMPQAFTLIPIPLYDGKEDGTYTISMLEDKSEMIPASLSVTRLPTPPPPEWLAKQGTLEKTLFQAKPAIRVTRQKTRDREVSLFFEHGPHWYRITLGTPNELEWDILLPFANTFEAGGRNLRVSTLQSDR